MKSAYNALRLIVAFLLISSIVSCSGNEKESVKTESSFCEIVFSMGTGDVPTKSEDQDDDESECPTMEELTNLVSKGYLVANISASDIDGQPVEHTSIKLTLSSQNIVSDPIVFKIDPDNEKHIEITQVCIVNTQTNTVIFSSINNTSQLAQYIEEECLLPKKVAMTRDMIYNKTPIDLCVYCTDRVTPEMFGYIKWNFTFKHIVCLPFSVNICTEEDGDITGVGTLITETGCMEKGVFSGDNKVYAKTEFPAGKEQLAELCFVANMGVDTSSDFYKFTMYIGNRVFSGVVSVDELLDYKNCEIWDKDMRYLHFWLCDGQPTWFMKEEGIINECSTSLIYNVKEDYNKTSTLFSYQSGNDWLPGLPTTETPNGVRTSCLIKKNEMFRINEKLEIHSAYGCYDAFTKIRVITDAASATPTLRLFLYDDNGNCVSANSLTAKKVNEGYLYSWSLGCNQCVESGCYYVKLSPSGNIMFKTIRIYAD